MRNFTKADYIIALQEKTGLDRQDCVNFMEAYAQITETALSKGHSIQLRGAWVIRPVMKKANVGQNIYKGELVRIPERIGLKFIPAKAMIERIRQWNAAKKEQNSHLF